MATPQEAPIIHAPERVRAIRGRATSDLQSVAALEGQIKDPAFRQRLQVIRHWLEDIESFFLASLSKESRTPQQEAYWLGQAEMLLEIIIKPQLKTAQDAFEKYGPSVTLVG